MEFVRSSQISKNEKEASSCSKLMLSTDPRKTQCFFVKIEKKFIDILKISRKLSTKYFVSVTEQGMYFVGKDKLKFEKALKTLVPKIDLKPLCKGEEGTPLGIMNDVLQFSVVSCLFEKGYSLIKNMFVYKFSKEDKHRVASSLHIRCDETGKVRFQLESVILVGSNVGAGILAPESVKFSLPNMTVVKMGEVVEKDDKKQGFDNPQQISEYWFARYGIVVTDQLFCKCAIGNSRYTYPLSTLLTTELTVSPSLRPGLEEQIRIFEQRFQKDLSRLPFFQLSEH